ncbi:peptide chain release factor 2 [Pelagibacteraceae bacterium]|nr:peptide chain release factor 2 [Pelagibacteraceae bacterium]
MSNLEIIELNLKKIRSNLDLIRGGFDYNSLKIKLEDLKIKSSDPNIWKKSDAKDIFQEIKNIENKIDDLNRLEESIKENQEIFNYIQENNEETLIDELHHEVKSTLKLSDKIRYVSLLNDEADHLNAFIEIHAGAGGTESQDWAEMLQRMYLRWSDNQENCEVLLLQEMRGEEAGIKSCTLKIIMNYSYGWLKAESGIHRLVRISPFDSNKRRHTSFASVWVYPEIDEKIEIDIKDSDLRIDTYRASGAGGQHVNKTDSAVRITHLPTNIVVQCQSDRSQHKNRSNAMKMIKSRIYETELQKRKEDEDIINKEKKDIGWGNQIRSYVLHPYKLIKDLRSGYETSNVNDVLDGKIDNFLENSLTL